MPLRHRRPVPLHSACIPFRPEAARLDRYLLQGAAGLGNLTTIVVKSCSDTPLYLVDTVRASAVRL